MTLVWLFLLPSLAIFALYRIIPMIWNVVLSLEFWSPYKPATFAGLYHYQEMLFYDDAFWQVLWNTILFMVSAPVGIALALGVALLVDTKVRGRNVSRTIVFMSYPVMTVAVGIIWQWLYNENVGLINYMLISLGVIDRGVPFLQSFDLALPAVIVASIWQVIGFYMIILLTGLQSIPPNLYEAASIDGASPMQTFRRITLPLLWPGILAGLMLAFVISLDDVVITNFVKSGGQDTLPTYMLGQLRRAITPEMNAISTVFLTLSLAIVTVFFFLTRNPQKDDA